MRVYFDSIGRIDPLDALGLPDFMVAFSGATLLAICNLPFGWILAHDAAAEVSGHRRKIEV